MNASGLQLATKCDATSSYSQLTIELSGAVRRPVEGRRLGTYVNDLLCELVSLITSKVFISQSLANPPDAA